jgi:hypothetical protein
VASQAEVPFHREEEEAVPFRLEVGAEGHQSQEGVEVRHSTRRREWVQRLCFCVVLRVQAAVLVVLAAAGPHLQQVGREREGWPRARSQRTSDRSAGRLLPRPRIVH